jgi:ATP-dependent Clp protease ATP-binding subunit ClpA
MNLVQQRIYNTSSGRAFAFTITDAAKNFLIAKGTDTNYGARYLKRTIERHVVQPLSNLIATAQVRGADWVRIDYADGNETLGFFKDAENLTANQMQMISGADIATLPGSAGLSTQAKK